MIAFVVRGLPAPQGSKSFKGLSRSGRAILVESSKRVRPWRLAVSDAALGARSDAPPLDGPVVLTLAFTLPRPASAAKRPWPHRMPDLSKLQRCVEDAITDAGLWTDDARVVMSIAVKLYPGQGDLALDSPGVRVAIRPVGPGDRVLAMTDTSMFTIGGHC